jgi:protein-L-isoaspartate(D-aspartate) O-methyltransferase
VKSVEKVEKLALAARERLARLGYGNVETRVGDGFLGWPEQGQFDAIIVTAAPEHVPPALVHQLRPGGRMVIPIGRPHATQSLVRVTKDLDGRIREEATLPVAFVPMLPATPN